MSPALKKSRKASISDFDSDGRLIGLEVIDATKSYSLSDIFNLSTENLILDKS